MAAGQLSLTRRALLAACAAPALTPASALRAEPGPDPTGLVRPEAPPPSVASEAEYDAWDYSLAHFRTTDAALEAAAHTEDEDLYDRLGERHDDAMHHLFRTPAPDVGALAVKLDVALDERILEFFGDLADMQAIKSDAHRLA